MNYFDHNPDCYFGHIDLNHYRLRIGYHHTDHCFGHYNRYCSHCHHSHYFDHNHCHSYHYYHNCHSRFGHNYLGYNRRFAYLDQAVFNRFDKH